MKQLIRLFFPLVIVALVFSCVSSNKASDDALQIRLERIVDKKAPKSVKDAVRNTSSDVLVGVGNAKMPDMPISRTTAETRARVDISRQINSVTTQIVRYYARTSETEPSVEETFRENITRTVSESTLTDVFTIMEVEAKDGSWWVVMGMERPALANELTAAQVSAKTAMPEMAAFDAETMLNTAVIIQKRK